MPAWANDPAMHVIDAHRHFDHTDNDVSFAAVGAELIAREDTRLRLSETQLLGMRFTPAPTEALPTRTFQRHHLVRFDLPGTEEYIDIGHVRRAHTGTRIVLGHGPVADRVQNLKSAGMSEREVVAHQLSADCDGTWGAGFLRPDVFVSSVYSTL